MKPYKMSLGKLINELKIVELETHGETKQDLRFVIDCLSDCGVSK